MAAKARYTGATWCVGHALVNAPCYYKGKKEDSPGTIWQSQEIACHNVTIPTSNLRPLSQPPYIMHVIFMTKYEVYI
jgi:hypothetical protein